jgi:CheY-specific phosphatase CheX
LQGLRVGRNNIVPVLKSNVDLGGVLLPERIGDDPVAGFAIARLVRSLRPELPIFLRRDVLNGEMATAERQLFAAMYSLDSMDELAEAVSTHIFSMVYPNVLVCGIMDMVRMGMENQFPSLVVHMDQPYLVHDRFMYGELSTLIPIDGSWYRGYMSLHGEEEALAQVIRAGKCLLPPGDADDFRSVNTILSELTNLVWGAFKNRFQARAGIAFNALQVPIVINHERRYISFGSANPQLCIRCVLTDPEDDTLPPVVLLHRFIFHLSWSPDDFDENEAHVESLMAAGEIEFF